MYYRRKIILSLLEAFGGELGRTDLQKLLFLYTREQTDPAYDFVPHHYGCYSFQAAYDQGALIHHGELEDTAAWRWKGAKSYVADLSSHDCKTLIKLRDDYDGVRGDDLVALVYRHYPYYAINSEVAEKVLDAEELRRVRNASPRSEETCLFTIGYEGKTIEEYLNQLLQKDVRLLCDVRKNACSRKFGFSKKRLQSLTGRVGIKYHHIPELGIASGKRRAVESEQAYARLFSRYKDETLPRRTEQLDEIADLLNAHNRIALTCFELRPEQCHRSRVAQALSDLPQWEYNVEHL